MLSAHIDDAEGHADREEGRGVITYSTKLVPKGMISMSVEARGSIKRFCL